MVESERAYEGVFDGDTVLERGLRMFQRLFRKGDVPIGMYLAIQEEFEQTFRPEEVEQKMDEVMMKAGFSLLKK
jgi:hypothetical protein